VDVSRFPTPDEFKGDDPTDKALCAELFTRANDYLVSFSWCKSIKATYVGDCLGGILALMLFQIEPAGADVDEWIWVVVGDLPPAYIAPASPMPYDALEDYVDQMERWVIAVQSGASVDDLIPVNVAPSAALASELEKRLRFIRENVLPTVLGAPPTTA
jgi:hypothetical protein